MPKTKVSSKKKPSSKVDVPSLDKLASEARDHNAEDEEYDDIFEEPTATPATVTRKPKPRANGHGLTEVSKEQRNLRDLFSAEETIIENITLDGAALVREPPKTESMAIFLRVRPLLPQEIARGENKGSFSVMPHGKGIALNPPLNSHLYRRLANSQDGKVGYEFTQVLGDDLQQREVFDLTMSKPIQEFLGGTSQLIFTYGVTNSGKTYTLLGPRGNAGILPRALDRIFAAIGHNVSQQCKYQPVRYEDVQVLSNEAQREAKDRRENYLALRAPKAPKAPLSVTSSSSYSSQSSQNTEGSQSIDSHGFFDYRPVSEANSHVVNDRDCIDDDAVYEAWVSFVEIYDDTAYDLLDPNNPVKTGRTLRSGTLKITDDGDTCFAKGLIEVPVFSAADAYHIMGIGRKNLHVAATKLNEASSRSHSIFTIKLVKVSRGKEIIVTQLTFCDLAGTERANRTDNIGTRLKESQNINKDLHHLKECIEALRKFHGSSRNGAPKKKKDLVPYRNCKLTRLFRSFFSGKGRASMIVNISQCATDFDETVQAIRFGSSAMRIMIAMTRRESILIQVPQFNGKLQLTHKNVVSVQMEMDSTIDESDEDQDENAPPSTVKKQPPARETISARTTVVKKKLTTAAKQHQDSAVKRSRARTVVKRPKARTADRERPLEQESTSEETSETSDTSTDHEEPPSDTTADEEEDFEQSEADLTIGGAVRGDHTIPDDFWEEQCPFPQHIHEQDPRVRGLLLLLGSCQNQIKQSKALNMANEMKVRKELCDYYDKEREKAAKEFERKMRKREQEYAEDSERSLQLQRDMLERQFSARGDPSLMSFEKNEVTAQLEEENEELKERVKELEQELAEALAS